MTTTMLDSASTGTRVYIGLRTFFARMLWAATGVGAVVGGLSAAVGVFLANGAPQEAAAAAIGCAIAIIPYVLARAFEEVTKPTL